MGGVAPNFTEWANGPGVGQSRDWARPKGKYGVAQLIPWVLWPPDDLNLKQGTCGEWFGYGYLPLPLTPPKPTTAGKDTPTGDQSWTLFLNTGNFKGPVAFFTPYFWSAGSVAEPRFAGMLLDSRPSDPNRALQMETQHVPSLQAEDAAGQTYARIAPTYFPRDAGGESRLLHHITSYDRRALWDAVKTWFEGGAEASGAISPEGAVLHRFTGKGGATWRIYPDETPREDKVPVAWTSFAMPKEVDPDTFGYRWNSNRVTQPVTPSGPLLKLPEYFRLERGGAKPQWIPVPAEEIPGETGLTRARFERPTGRKPKTFVTPENPARAWRKPGHRPQGRSLPGPPGGRHRKHLRLVSIRRPTGPAQRRSHGSGTGSPAGARRETAPELEEGYRLPGPTGIRQTGRPRPGPDRHAAPPAWRSDTCRSPPARPPSRRPPHSFPVAPQAHSAPSADACPVGVWGHGQNP